MITFKQLRYKNFLSSGNEFITVQLDKCPTTLIIGENGAGKSTILEALNFSLFGTAFSKKTKSQLVNSINNKDCIVELDFDKGSDNYTVRRGIKPNTFEVFLNGEQLDVDSSTKLQQEKLENIISMNQIAFKQIVLLGKSSYTPFMRLNALDRRNLIEELLDLTVFSRMKDVVKADTVQVNQRISDIKTSIKTLESKEAHFEHEIKRKEAENESAEKENAKADVKPIEIDYTEDIKKAEELIIETTKKLDVIGGQHAKKIDTLKPVDVIEQITSKIRKLGEFQYKFKSDMSTAKKNIKFFGDNDVCPTCSQEIEEELKRTMVADSSLDHETAQGKLAAADKKISEQEYIIDQQHDVQKSIREYETKISSFKGQIMTLQSDLKVYNSKAEVVEIKARVVDILSTEYEDKQLIDIRVDIVNNLSELDGAFEDVKYLKKISDLVSDKGIKTAIVDKYIPFINKTMNGYLEHMNLFVDFTLDSEFNETILSRHRDKFTYESFSEGEKLRIDIALLFTWREVSKMKNSISTNLLVLDEIFDSSLDEDGVNSFTSILKGLKDSNVFIISHTPEKIGDVFEEVVEFKKGKKFSEKV